jgi:hypothetical protein
MNHSLMSADRNTHLKIVVVALVAATVVIWVGITTHVAESTATTTVRIDRPAPVLKAGKPATYTRSDDPAIR